MKPCLVSLSMSRKKSDSFYYLSGLLPSSSLPFLLSSPPLHFPSPLSSPNHHLTHDFRSRLTGQCRFLNFYAFLRLLDFSLTENECHYNFYGMKKVQRFMFFLSFTKRLSYFLFFSFCREKWPQPYCLLIRVHVKIVFFFLFKWRKSNEEKKKEQKRGKTDDCCLRI